MLLLGAILLAIFVVPWPWGLVVVIAGGTIDVVESLAMLRWSRRRRAVTGAEALIGQRAIVSICADGGQGSVALLQSAAKPAQGAA